MADDGGHARYSRRTVLAAMAGAAVVGAGAGGIVDRTILGTDDGGAPTTPSIKLDRTPVAPFPRSQHATAVLAGPLILCIGGVSPDGTLASCQVYDPDKD